jgi:hypothetical protein
MLGVCLLLLLLMAAVSYAHLGPHALVQGRWSCDCWQLAGEKDAA